MFTLIKKLKLFFIKRRILKNLPHVGCDMDGDIIIYKNKKYFVHGLAKIVEEIK